MCSEKSGKCRNTHAKAEAREKVQRHREEASAVSAERIQNAYVREQECEIQGGHLARGSQALFGMVFVQKPHESSKQRPRERHGVEQQSR